VGLHPYTPWIISVGAVIFGIDGLFMVLRIPNRTWGDWGAYVGGMILFCLLAGLLAAVLLTLISKFFWLPSWPSRSLGRRRKKKYSANERLALSIDTLAIAAKANLENTRSQLLQPFLVFGIV